MASVGLRQALHAHEEFPVHVSSGRDRVDGAAAPAVAEAVNGRPMVDKCLLREGAQSAKLTWVVGVLVDMLLLLLHWGGLYLNLDTFVVGGGAKEGGGATKGDTFTCSWVYDGA